MSEPRAPGRLRIAAEKLALTLLSGVLLGLPSLDHRQVWASGLALVPWLLLLAHPRWHGGVPMFALGYYAALCIQYRFLGPIAGPAGQVMFLWLLPLSLPWAFVASRIVRRLPSIPLCIVAPVTWTASEWMRLELAPAKVDLFPIGYNAAPMRHLVQAADLGGVFLLSFLLAFFSGLVADVVLAAARARTWRVHSLPVVRKRIIAGAVVLAAWLGWGFLAGGVRPEGTPLRVGILQPNYTHAPDRVPETHLAQVLMSLKWVEPGSVDLLAWPENAILDDVENPDTGYLLDLRWLAGRLDAPILLGTLLPNPEDERRTSNICALVTEEGVVARYAKRLLVPWTESTPFQPLLALIHPDLPLRHRLLIRKVFKREAIGTPGTGPLTLAWDRDGSSRRLFAPICFENTYGPLSRAARREGAELALNLTSESSLGTAMQVHLLHVAMVRAVECRMPFARVGNGGISGVIDSSGRLAATLRGSVTGRAIGESGYLAGELQPDRRARTLYVLAGDWPAWLSALASVALLGLALVRRPAPRPDAPAASAAGPEGTAEAAPPGE